MRSQFIELLDVVVDEKDREVLKYDGKDMEESQELDLPEIADDTGTNAETVKYGYDGFDPGLEKMDRKAPTEFWYLAMDP